MGADRFTGDFVVIPTDLFSDPSICGIGYGFNPTHVGKRDDT
ncbi:hypothetical protein LEP1GSC051_0767 [Leptospira sp. P2653]|nr:hypothetical protein LEP1GSC051_0767 [Leptospira sp. P2653]